MSNFKLFQFLLEETEDVSQPTSRFNVGPVYHGGTWNGIKAIKVTGRGALGSGAYFTPMKDVAEKYASESGGEVIETYLDIKNPLKIYRDSSNQEHPVIDAMMQLGVSQEKAIAVVEKIEEKYGYVGTQLKTLALAKGYDGIFQYYDGKLREIVIWNKDQVKYR